jgi:hypothetical protein
MSRSRSTEGESDRRRPPAKASEIARQRADLGAGGAQALRQRLGNEGMRRLLGENGSNGVPAVQVKLTVSEPGDKHEEEADHMADAVMRAPSGGQVQRMCSDCEEEKKVSRAAEGERAPEVGDTASANIGAMRGGGSELPSGTREFFEPKFGADFSRVRVHTDARAADTADALDAKAFTVGNDIAFARGEFAPHSGEGQKLLAHELTHVVQQNGKGAAVKRDKKKDSDKEKNKGEKAASGANKYGTISMAFDGLFLTVFGDGKEILRFFAESGRPTLPTEEHVRECGADRRVDTYMSAVFAGIEDHGPIPEGEFQFNPSQIENFSFSEQMSLLWSGLWTSGSVKFRGRMQHAGDWGRGRVRLDKIRTQDAPCGNPHTRHSFYLHGGVIQGSAGCIDIGSRFPELADFLAEFKKPIRIKVKYVYRTPRVGFFSGLLAGINYKSGIRFRHGPTGLVGSEFGGGAGPKLVLDTEYRGTLAWAGGLLAAGVHMNIPMSSEDKFVRFGFRGTAEFRLLNAMYGQLMGGGYYQPAQGNTPADYGTMLGAGLSYDAGTWRFKLLYQHVNAMRGRDHDQILAGIGFNWDL